MSKRLFWPFILLFLGIILLLHNLGVIPWRFLSYWPVLLILLGFLVLAGPWRILSLLAQDRRVQPPVSSELQSSGALDTAAAVRVDLHARRGHLGLTADPGEHLCTARAFFEWESDRPSLIETPAPREGRAGVAFLAGRRSAWWALTWLGGGGELPRYEVNLGRPGIPHELGLRLNAGWADLNLAGLNLADLALTVNSGRCRVNMDRGPVACRSFSAVMNSGELDLAGLGALGAPSYYFKVNSGRVSADLAGLAPGEAPSLMVEVNSGNVALALPPGARFDVELRIISGMADISGRQYHGGRHQTSIGAGKTAGRLRIRLISGLVRMRQAAGG